MQSIPPQLTYASEQAYRDRGTRASDGGRVFFTHCAGQAAAGGGGANRVTLCGNHYSAFVHTRLPSTIVRPDDANGPDNFNLTPPQVPDVVMQEATDDCIADESGDGSSCLDDSMNGGPRESWVEALQNNDSYGRSARCLGLPFHIDCK